MRHAALFDRRYPGATFTLPAPHLSIISLLYVIGTRNADGRTSVLVDDNAMAFDQHAGGGRVFVAQ